MISLPVTSLTAVACAVILIILTYRVILLRRKDGVVLGDNDDRILTKAIRGHGNASEQMPLALILLGLIEVQGGNPVLTGTLAAIFVAGRALHGVYFGRHGTPWQFRFYGMMLTMLAQAGLVLALLFVLL
ncbi:MAPEG family protein [Yoonia sediminilitoris]|uniref:Glutathione S-transferase n=1 Tax=Yoonia sediminilitoris TaxID=1286148 RepID=A0A2T6KQ09_9RHOB|nr:MAPEG family protein [Yoonia sediminilitoris]PUB18646.1 hypothetical protein C8N45_101231 [Yoonia sediminilitoris]RCW98814.1 hypothetical protein DFP92_101231 [Yoonia sediminilitoris]